MDNVFSVQEPQALNQGVGEPPDEAQTETLVVVLLDQLVQVQVHELEADAQVVPEVEVVQHVDDVVSRIAVLLAEMVEDLDFDQRLVVKPLLVPDDLDGDVLARLVVQRADDLAERPLADHLEDLVPVRDVVVQHLVVGAVLVVEATVLRRTLFAVDLGRLVAEVPDLGVGVHLLALVLRQPGAVVLDGLRW